jgi:hypothetical protein
VASVRNVAGAGVVILRSTRVGTSAIVRSAAAILLLAFAQVGQAQTSGERAVNPFIGMEGSWTGNGVITFGSGEKERIRCRVTYAVEPSPRVDQDLRCASDSYKFELSSTINYANGFVTGRWNERTQQTSGTISGKAVPGQIDALVETSGFAAFFTMITRGDRQSVHIESKSAEVTDVTITLRRAGR